MFEEWLMHATGSNAAFCIIAFLFLTLFAAVGEAIVIYTKLDCWKFQIVWIALMEVLGAVLTIVSL